MIGASLPAHRAEAKTRTRFGGLSVYLDNPMTHKKIKILINFFKSKQNEINKCKYIKNYCQIIINFFE